jgi:gluconolactonase
VQIKRLPLSEPDRVSVLVEEANGANGMAADLDGNLIVCEQGSRWQPARITRVDRRTGARHTIVDNWRGLPLNSPNDVVVAGDGAIWFTDPSYGHLQGFRPEPMVGDLVYRHDPATGQTTVVADGFDKPNGIAFARRAHPVRHRQRRQPGARQLLRRASAPHQGLRRGARSPPCR